MPFSINSAPEVFQRKMHELVEDLEGVKVVADDFMVVGFGESEEETSKSHNAHLSDRQKSPSLVMWPQQKAYEWTPTRFRQFKRCHHSKMWLECNAS